MSRKYVKSSNYWQMPRKIQPQPPQVIVQTAASQPVPMTLAQGPLVESEVVAAMDNNAHYSATAACGGGDVSNVYRDQSAPSILDTNRYKNIRSGIMPLYTVEGNYGMGGAIGLVYQAYFNFAILRNAINLLCDFSVSKIHVKTTNKRVKGFIETWFEAINVNQFMTQFFLEYYRSGNVFIYKFAGKISDDGFNMLKQSYSGLKGLNEVEATKSRVVPIRYIILNPMQVYLQRGASYTYGYVRMLSTYEIERLKNPQTEEDKQIFRSFPTDIQRQIKQGGSWRYLFVPLDQNRLYYVFYRKQDYEPLAVPMAFPVLNDIEFKLELRRMDTALARTIEQVILLVTTGRQADQFNQAMGAKNLAALQSMFQSQTIGRVLVADFTTKAEWLVPDLKELLGPAKYERVDKDIKEGLQYMFFGDEKFANASIKVKIFIESLREGRRAFLENFLKPEVKKICEAMAFKNIPELEFEEVQIQDEALMNRLYVQLAQLGLLDPDETFTAMRTGMMPTKEESLEHQQDYKAQRGKGLYTPLAPPMGGGGGGASSPNGRPGGSGGTPATRQVSTPIGQKKVTGGVAGASFAAEENVARDSRYHFGMTKVAENLVKMNGIREDVDKAIIKKWKVKGGLSDAQQSIASSIAQSIVFNEDEDGWTKAVSAYVKEPKELSKETRDELTDIGATFEVDSWTAAVLARSKVDFTSIT